MFTFNRDMSCGCLAGILIPAVCINLVRSGWLENLPLLVILIAVFLLAIWLNRSAKPK